MGKVLLNAATVECADPRPVLPVMDFIEGESPNMRPVEAAIRELANSDVPVLLRAEAGAGKSSTAQRIHDMSWRKEQPFQ